MLRVTRLYNKNRRLIWLWVIIAIFCIAIIAIFNNVYKEQTEKESEKLIQASIEKSQKEETSETVNYEKASISLTSGKEIETSVRDEIQKILEQFIKYSCQSQTQEAYKLLTTDCKNLKYPSEEIFAQNYCSDIIDKTYTFECWNFSNGIYTYRVKFFNNLLSSGIDTTQNFLQDYITVVKEDGEYKLNISNFIRVKNINKEQEVKNIKIKVNNVETYMDYEIYEIEVKNNSNKQIILDPLEEDNSTYVKNSDGLKIRALLYENKEEEFTIPAGESEKLKIKFNNTYNVEKYSESIGFSNVIYDQKEYENDTEHKKGKIEIEVYLR